MNKNVGETPSNEHVAAVAIQRIVRGHQTRLQLKDVDRKITILQSHVRRRAAQKSYRGWLNSRRESKNIDESIRIRELKLRRFEEEFQFLSTVSPTRVLIYEQERKELAAVTIQKNVKRMLALMEVQRLRDAQKPIFTGKRVSIVPLKHKVDHALVLKEIQMRLEKSKRDIGRRKIGSEEIEAKLEVVRKNWDEVMGASTVQRREKLTQEVQKLTIGLKMVKKYLHGVVPFSGLASICLQLPSIEMPTRIDMPFPDSPLPDMGHVESRVRDQLQRDHRLRKMSWIQQIKAGVDIRRVQLGPIVETGRSI